MIVVTGCPRSGTSLMMQCLKKGLGEKRLFGEEFPSIAARKRSMVKADSETDEQYSYRMYVARSEGQDDDQVDERAKNMNPKGFWECPFTVAGISWRPGIDDQVSQILDEIGTPGEGYCKIVSNGLARSDPRFISKVIIMARDPRSVAKSQENLQRKFMYRRPGMNVRNLYDGMKLNSPKMFIDTTFLLARWMDKHDIPFRVVQYDDVIDNASDTLKGVFKFLGVSKAAAAAGKASSAVDPSLKRSYPESKHNLLWDDADKVYDMLSRDDFGGLCNFFEDETRMSHREDKNWVCVRSGTRMVEQHCKRCYTDRTFAMSVRRAAQAQGVNWKTKPCAWEVAYRTDGEPMASIDDSIVNNHWITEDDKKREAFEARRLEHIKAGKARLGKE